MFHEAMVVGHLGRDPEMKYKQGGEAYTRFSVAANEHWGGEDHTTWYNVTTWNPKVAEACNRHLRKGSLVLVKGTVSARGYMGGDGEPKASLDLNARVVKFLSTSGSGTEEEEIPF